MMPKTRIDNENFCRAAFRVAPEHPEWRDHTRWGERWSFTAADGYEVSRLGHLLLVRCQSHDQWLLYTYDPAGQDTTCLKLANKDDVETALMEWKL